MMAVRAGISACDGELKVHLSFDMAKLVGQGYSSERNTESGRSTALMSAPGKGCTVHTLLNNGLPGSIGSRLAVHNILNCAARDNVSGVPTRFMTLIKACAKARRAFETSIATCDARASGQKVWVGPMVRASVSVI